MQFLVQLTVSGRIKKERYDMQALIINAKKYSFLIQQLVTRDIRLKYRRSYMGYIWTLLEPLLTMLVLCFVFSQLKGKSDRLFPLYVLTGKLIYTFFSGATKSAMKSIQSNSAMLRKVNVPKMIYPLTTILSNFIFFLLSLVVLIGVAFVLQAPVSWMTLFSLVPIILIFFMSTGVGLILATLEVFFRDMQYLWNVALTMIMYTCAIFYDVSLVVENGYDWVLRLNPVYMVILLLRQSVIPSAVEVFRWQTFGITAAFSFALFFLGIYIFQKNEDKFIFYV